MIHLTAVWCLIIGILGLWPALNPNATSDHILWSIATLISAPVLLVHIYRLLNTRFKNDFHQRITRYLGIVCFFWFVLVTLMHTVTLHTHATQTTYLRGVAFLPLSILFIIKVWSLISRTTPTPLWMLGVRPHRLPIIRLMVQAAVLFPLQLHLIHFSVPERQISGAWFWKLVAYAGAVMPFAFLALLLFLFIRRRKYSVQKAPSAP